MSASICVGQLYREVQVRTQNDHFSGILHTTISERTMTALFEFAYVGKTIEFRVDLENICGTFDEYVQFTKDTALDILSVYAKKAMYDAVHEGLKQFTKSK